MYLKEISAHGFKSFADKTLIELNNNITGIVGPNGSGKSNVVDAVRWVLGEQSVKSLRGDVNMTDVIFSGSKSRNPSQTASVTLIFDNSDNYLPLDYNEISIKRRVYKDGTNEYFFNGEKVRYKDIVNILLDSGMGKESFNIISQGKIEEILSNKPEDRRIIFEDAAGVLKYKKRKEEALRKLDKTHENMNRVNDIINELNNQIVPLKEQKDKALKFQELNSELENIEIALITQDITNLNFEYQDSKNKIEILQNEIVKISSNNMVGESKILEYKNNLSNLDLQIRKNQEQLLNLTTKSEQLNSRKALILERQKYNADDIKVHENLVLLKEKELNLNNEYCALKNDIDSISCEINNLKEKYEFEVSKLNEIKNNKSKLTLELSDNLKKENSLNIKIEGLKYSIDNNSSIPLAVKKILDNPKLRGIHNILGNLFDVEEKYSCAISTVLAASLTNIVVDNEGCAKEAINYLKNNNIGRATFLPLSIIKPKFIDKETLNLLSDGFIGIASSLIMYDKKYDNIILNQLGNVIVADNLDNANKIAKLINYKYRIVTLSGDLLHVGGSLTGGNVLKSHNVILEKYDLENNIKLLNKITEEIKTTEEKLNLIDDEYKQLEDKIYLINKDILDKQIIFETYSKNLAVLKENIKLNTIDINSMNNTINKGLEEEEQEILKEYYECLNEKNTVDANLNSLIKQKYDLSNDLSYYEIQVKKENSLCNEKNNELKQLEILVNRLDVKLDTLLNTLSENYTLTYEAAVEKYKLDMPDNIARNKVNNLKKTIHEIGPVNLAAIEEFEHVNTRYEFLNTQKDDLTKAENTLLEIIDQMDKVMISEFTETFKTIKDNFIITFKELFKGGTADLKLTNPENILETGIEILACPPGKKVNSISLLSGGEKTFTAISLLFAILKSKPVPFCILDEVEAALDDVNVDSFGKYIQNLKDKTQFIIITHKKKTMEYVDTLYGITMQESGVSKLVSVKLADIK